MNRRIEDYALLGDLHTAALVGRDGSIDWMCAPRFDSGAFFAALLGDARNGRWLIAARDGRPAARRRYRDGSLVLESRFETAGGAATVIDFMPRRKSLERVDLVRIVRGERGATPMRLDLTLRFDYGRTMPWLRRRDYGLHAVAGPDAVSVRSPIALRNSDFHTTAEFEVHAGETLDFSLTWHASLRGEPAGPDAQRALEETDAWWRRWSKRLRYRGPWREAVQRSLITLKALTYGPSGGIVAAPTTSLPEQPGGERNWDYRYCWLRDATLTLYALLRAGYKDEARAWREWLLRAVAGRPEEIQIMYGVAGERRLPEIELPWLAGYAASRPVRIGNGAHSQVQLDIFGEIMDMFDASRAHGIADEDSWQVQKVLLECLESRWDEPGEGIWEVRGEPRRFTHGKVLAWVAVDRCVRAVEHYGLDGPVERWRGLRATIHQDVCNKGFSVARNAFVQYYGGEALDAAVLMIPRVGFLPPEDARVVATVEAIQRELVMDGFVQRYAGGGVDGLPEGEGAFLACSFWLIDCLHMIGRRAQAEELMGRVLAVANDVGLLAEEYDPVARRLLGNFPQAFSHIALVNSALRLAGDPPAGGKPKPERAGTGTPAAS